MIPETAHLQLPMAPEQLEQSIDAAALWLATAKTREQRVSACRVLEALVKARSAERVRQMELEQGLAR